MNTLLLTLGSHGDIHPFIALGKALRERGHGAIVASNPYFGEQIAESGLMFEPLGERLDLRTMIEDHKIMDSNRGPLNVFRQLILPYVRDFVKWTRELLRKHQPDRVIYHPIVVGVPWACELEGGVPTVSITLSPTLWGTEGDPLVMLPFHGVNPGAFASRFDRWISTWFMRLALDGGLNHIRRELQLPPQRDHLRRHGREAGLNLALWSPLFRPPLPGDPANSFITGFTWHDRDHTQEPPSGELSRFLDAGEPPILFSLGSTGVHAAGRFFHSAVEATRALGARALLVVGRDQRPPDNMPRDGSMLAVAYAPFSSIFPRASVVIHHGGVGTTAQALASGRPTLITPMAHDQFDNAARVRRLGCGETIHFRKVNAKRFAHTLALLRNDNRYANAAAAIAPRIAAEDGAARAAELIVGSWNRASGPSIR
jgi:rhamnosyltransferase subunit B